jgi:PAS domain S-box-containing protein
MNDSPNRDAIPDPRHRGRRSSRLDGSVWRATILRIGLPVVISLLLCIGVFFRIALPDFDASLMDAKAAMIREMTAVAEDLLQDYDRRVEAGELTLEEAQSRAKERLRSMRYGPEGKDYYWITDMEPVMIMHPYVTELQGRNVREFRDEAGIPLFQLFVQQVRESGEGIVDYHWQWKDDPTRTGPKRSYVRGFEPWGWIVGTGVYTEDVDHEISQITARTRLAFLGALAVITLVSGYVIWNGVSARRRQAEAEEALRQSEAILAQSHEVGGIGAWEWDFEEHRAWWSPQMYRLFGVDPDAFEPTRSAIRELVVESDWDAYVAVARRAAEEGRAEDMSLRIRRPDGAVRELQGRVIGFRDTTGRSIRLVAAAQDVTEQRDTERKRLEEIRFLEITNEVDQILRAERDLDRAMALVLDVVLPALDVDRAWLLTPADPKADRWSVPHQRSVDAFHVEPDALLDLPMTEEDSDAIQRMSDAKQPVAFGAKGEHDCIPSMERFDAKAMLVVALQPTIGEPWIFGVHQCARERIWTPDDRRLLGEIGHRLQESLSTSLLLRDIRRSEEKYRQLTETMVDTIFVTDADGRMTYLSPRVVDLTGQTPDAFLEQPLAALLSDWDHAQTHEAGDIYESTVRGRGGTETPVEISVSPVVTPGGDEAGLLGVIRDITQRRQAERDRRRSEQILSSAFKALDGDLAVIDRDFRIVVSNRDDHALVHSIERPLQCFEVIRQSSRPCSNCPPAAVFDDGETRRYEEFDPVDERHKEISVSPIFDEDGRVQMIVEYASDITKRKRAEEAIKQSEAVLKATLESTPDGVLVVDEAGHVSHHNTRFQEMWSIPDEVLLHCDDAGLIRHAAAQLSDPARFLGRIEQHYDGDESAEDVIELVDGRVVESRTAPLIRDGLQAGRIWMFRDITAIRRTEEARRASERQYRDLVENALVGVYRASVDGVVRYANDALLQMTGFESVADLNRHPRCFLRTDLNAHNRLVAELDPDGRIHHRQMTIRCRNGDMIQTLISVDRDGDLLSGMIMDISELEQAKRTLERRMRMQELVAAVSADFVNLPPDRFDAGVNLALQHLGSFLDVDRSYLFQFSDDGLYKSNTHEWCRDGVRSEMHHLQHLPLDEFAWSTRIYRQFGVQCVPRVRDLPPEAAAEREEFMREGIQSLMTVPLRDGRRPIGFIGVDAVRAERDWEEDDVLLLQSLGGVIANAIKRYRSQNELRELNEELEDRVRIRTRELEAANEELEAFSYSVCHDLRAPLRRVDGYSLALLEDCADAIGDAGQQYVDRIRQGCADMGELIDALLRLSRVTWRVLEPEQVDISATARAVCDELAERHEGPEVECRIQPSLVAAGDRQLLRLALENLIGNAFKFTRDAEHPVVEITGATSDAVQSIYVSDNGIGFDPEQANSLFQPFRRLHEQGRFPGMGIGLATTKRIAERHGGTILAEVNPEGGATFCLSLPA